MVDVKKVTDTYSVAPQIDIDDFEALKSSGFTMVINNRPDGESFGQLKCDDAKRKCESLGLDYKAVPIAGPQDLLASCEAINSAIADAKGPILAYCRSGTRSVTLWSLATVQSGAETPETAIEKARLAGYDLSHLRGTLDDLTTSN